MGFFLVCRLSDVSILKAVILSLFFQHGGSWNGFDQLSPRRQQMNIISALGWWIWHHGCAYGKFQISQLEGLFQEIKNILSKMCLDS